MMRYVCSGAWALRGRLEAGGRLLSRRLPAMGAVEYIVIAAVLITVVGVGMDAFGDKISEAFTGLGTKLTGQSWATK